MDTSTTLPLLDELLDTEELLELGTLLLEDELGWPLLVKATASVWLAEIPLKV